jgi:hypothetical protein
VPWAAKARAVAAPMPWFAPVIKATFPLSPGSIIDSPAFISSAIFSDEKAHM